MLMGPLTQPKQFDFDKLQTVLAGAKTDKQLFQAIVNAPFEFRLPCAVLSLGIIVLLLVNPRTGMVDRVALSNTEPAKGAVNISAKPFEAIKIPLDHEPNIIVKAIKTGRPQETTDWRYLFEPDLTPKQARFNQAGAGIGCSCVHPLTGARDGGGALIFSYYDSLENLGPEHQNFMQRYSALVSDRLQA